jgi:hypothetical protein
MHLTGSRSCLRRGPSGESRSPETGAVDHCHRCRFGLFHHTKVAGVLALHKNENAAFYHHRES